jgi:26S proteasome regulatory subunit N9
MANSLLANAMSVYGTRNDRLTEKYLSLGELYDRRQWHQLTNELDIIIHDESLWIDRNILDLYKDFVEKFETKLNPLRLVMFVESASKQHFTGDGFEPASETELLAALDLMEAIAKKAFLSEEARSVAKMRICDYLIALKRTAEAKKLLEDVSSKFAKLEGSGAESTVKSSFYRAESNYFRQVGPAGGESLCIPKTPNAPFFVWNGY